MKFATASKLALLLLMAAVFALALTGCGSTNNLALTQGNWSVTATSTATPQHRNPQTPNVSNVSFYVGGNLTQAGSNITGTMYITGSECFDPSNQVNFTGTVHDKAITLTSPALDGQVITVAATGTDAADLTGTYSVAGGCDDGDSGTVTANAVPSISATWSGTLVNASSLTNGNVSATISIALAQAATASSDGTFALTGNITYTNSVCSVSGTVGAGSFVSGQFVLINAGTIDQSEGTGSFTFGLAPLDSATAPANMTGGYTVNDGDCAGDIQTLTLTKQ
jgi:hypothetical protein